MTAARFIRTYVTDMYKSLAKKIGEDGAYTPTNYLEDFILAQIEDKVRLS